MTTPKRPRGRPRLADETGLLKMVAPIDLLDRCARAAEAAGVTVSEWARGVLDRAARRALR